MEVKMNMGEYQSDFEAVLSQLSTNHTIERIWQRDHSVWKPKPDEIANRLGWLTITEIMRPQLGELDSFSHSICQAGIQYIVLLGMGGSSLGAEVLRSAFGKQDGYPELIVLDSIHPGWIKQVEQRIDIEQSLFMISSKSGSTIEPDSLYDYFRTQVEATVGEDKAGDHFMAITDMSSPLSVKAENAGFRKIFTNPSDIGGRYSVLSYFGMVPAVLAGIDIGDLLDEADRMKEACRHNSPRDNPGCLLGAIMGLMALNGRDKLTLVTSPGINRFGLWAEQLIAESIGKEGKGIIPVADEPLVDPKFYGDDRFFVFLRMEGDDNQLVDASIQSIKESGQPVMTIEMSGQYALGAEFFRWEFAVAIAASMIGVNPYDQPDVQRSKDATRELLKAIEKSGTVAPAKSDFSLDDLLQQAKAGDYLAIMAYLVESESIDSGICKFRKQITERYQIATTFGYGPRFLHSTGQLHKGGPSTGLFLHLTANHDTDLAIPGKSYSFGQLTSAQAMGDLQILRQLERPIASYQFDSQDLLATQKLRQLLSLM